MIMEPFQIGKKHQQIATSFLLAMTLLSYLQGANLHPSSRLTLGYFMDLPRILAQIPSQTFGTFGTSGTFSTIQHKISHSAKTSQTGTVTCFS